MAVSAKKTLIIKIGATGDVVRTTPLLRVLEGEVHWLTSSYNSVLMPTDCDKLSRVFTIENDWAEISKHNYDLILSLDEDPVVTDVLGQLKTRYLTGVYTNGNGLQYSTDAAGWFDMSLISVFDKKHADRLKYENRKTYQELIFRSAGEDFNGQPYWINLPDVKIVKGRVGIEKRVGSRWQAKKWWAYDILSAQLQQQGYSVLTFAQRDTLADYMIDIGSCEYIITGDTLAMHIALAYGISTLAIFTCTAPWEIYGYGCLHKVVSPALEKSFYKTTLVLETMEAIAVDEVMDAFIQMTRIMPPGAAD